jgi:hypothetical protein
VGTERVWYFAYGSNMQTATLCGRRGVEVLRALPARVVGWRLVFDKPPLFPTGESTATIVAEAGAHVLGVLYEVTPAALERIEVTEGVLLGNYTRVEVAAESPGSPAISVAAATLTCDRHDPALRPSDRYLAFVIAGALEHGLPAEYVEWLRAVPVHPEGAEARQLRALIDEALRGFKAGEG